MKISIIFFVFVLFQIISSMKLAPNRCLPCCYAWIPWIPPFYLKNLVQLECPPGSIHYVAKTVTMDEDSRVVPAHLQYTDHVVHRWQNDSAKQRIGRHIDLLMGNAEIFKWVHVDANNTIKSIKKNHCLLEGGGWPGDKGDTVFYIGYAKRKNRVFIGRVSQSCECLHSVDGWDAVTFHTDFCILSYDCRHDNGTTSVFQ